MSNEQDSRQEADKDYAFWGNVAKALVGGLSFLLFVSGAVLIAIWF